MGRQVARLIDDIPTCAQLISRMVIERRTQLKQSLILFAI